MNKILENKSVIVLVIIGLFFTIFSFVYYYLLNNPINVLLYIICAIDIVLFSINAYVLSKFFNLSNINALMLSLLIVLGYFVLILFCAYLYANSINYNFTIMLVNKIMMISLFLSPSIIILILLILYLKPWYWK